MYLWLARARSLQSQPNSVSKVSPETKQYVIYYFQHKAKPYLVPIEGEILFLSLCQKQDLVWKQWPKGLNNNNIMDYLRSACILCG